ncbi:MAG: NAD(P)/FAD-dependent oxidoreductase [Planctomycetota bacterium]
MKKFDLIIIGSGPAASVVASQVSKQDKNLAIVESRIFGGTCALRGCNPKKVYTNAGNLVDQARRMNGKSVNFENISINWQQLHQFQRQFVEPVEQKSQKSFQKKGFETFLGIAAFTGPNEITVDGQTLSADKFFIATGAEPVKLPIDGFEHVIDSSEFLGLTDLPKRVCFIGGGYISMEYGCVALRFGSEVTVLQRGGRILQPFDPDLVDQLSNSLKEDGMDLQVDSEVVAVEKIGDRFTVKYERQGQQEMLEADLVIHGAGRKPNIDSLDLAKANIDFNQDGILVDSRCQSISNPSVFAAGDCVASGKPMLTTTAVEEGRVVAQNVFEDTPTAEPNYEHLANVAFTSPPIASIGMSEAEAKEQCKDLGIKYAQVNDWGSVRKTWQTCSAYKLLIDKSNDKLLGAHLLGPKVDETINLFVLAMRFGIKATDLKQTLYAFPTFGYNLRNMI